VYAVTEGDIRAAYIHRR